MDVKNAFLNGDLSEEVYMTPPPGVSLPSGHVCRLRKALYGLKQAPRAWFEKFSNTVLSLGFSASNYDSGLFTRTTAAGSILLLLYVDDMIITGSDSTGIASLKQSLSSAFEMKDLGKLHYFLGLEVLSDVSGTYLCQAKYISDLLSKAGLSDTKVASTPLEYNLHLTPSASTPLQDPTRYRQLVGSLVYLTVTRPDIAYAVHTVRQFMAAPRSDHYAAILRILRYLKGTMFHGLYFFSTSSLDLRGFSDADWDSDMTDRRSTIGYCFFLGDSLISWRSKKQSLIARSSTEAEYRALADTSQELIWLRWLLSDMGAPQKSPTPLWCDNNSAIQIAHNDVFHERTKHIEIDCHFVRQHVVRNTIRLHPISTLDEPADIFTKAHLPGRFRELSSEPKRIEEHAKKTGNHEQQKTNSKQAIGELEINKAFKKKIEKVSVISLNNLAFVLMRTSRHRTPHRLRQLRRTPRLGIERRRLSWTVSLRGSSRGILEIFVDFIILTLVSQAGGVGCIFGAQILFDVIVQLLNLTSYIWKCFRIAFPSQMGWNIYLERAHRFNKSCPMDEFMLPNIKSVDDKEMWKGEHSSSEFVMILAGNVQHCEEGA
ncbi:hypothetical protein OSB04_005756, partial [Centaurea solstitialis]